MWLICFFFFFKQKTAYELRISDWSSDVCSSDLPSPAHSTDRHRARTRCVGSPRQLRPSQQQAFPKRRYGSTPPSARELTVSLSSPEGEKLRGRDRKSVV